LKDKELNDDKIKNNILPVILSGGTGSRLWPLSRSCFPKQYLSLEENTNKTLIQNTFLRINNIKNLENPLIICSEEHRFIVAEQMRSINVKPKKILLEPFSKNTAPAIALAALTALEKNEDPLLLVLAADHKIEDADSLKTAIYKGINFALEGKIIIFGVRPNSAETGYGYIESYNQMSENITSSKVKKFIEKPNKTTAQKLIKDCHFCWNSGIFLFKASTIVNELKKFDKNIINACDKSLSSSAKDLDFQRVNREKFKDCPEASIDVAVMEKTDLAYVIRLDCGWNDLGSWKSIWEDSKTDKNQNTVKGRTFIKEVRNSYIRSENRLIVGFGLNEILIVETDDAVFVANKNAIKSMKDLVKELAKKDFHEYKSNRKVHRPWGYYKSISKSKNWQVKKIEINPNASLSLQLHKQRAEHWIVVNGIAKVEIDGVVTYLKNNESIYVPLGSKHRLSNPGDSALIIIEVQSGKYLGEDDIVRFDDIYGRIG